MLRLRHSTFTRLDRRRRGGRTNNDCNPPRFALNQMDWLQALDTPASQPVSAQLHGAEKHRHLADLLNHDPKTVAGVFASICALTLGYPDRAMRLKR
jgi:hypothetical protein